MRNELVLDTSVFVNPASSAAFGTSPTEALTHFLEIARGRDDVRFLVPPSIYVELMHFAEEAKIPKDLLVRLEQRAPRKHETRVPGMFLYTLVESMRERVDRGLRLAERHVREALQAPRSEAGRRIPTANRSVRTSKRSAGCANPIAGFCAKVCSIRAPMWTFSC